MKIKDLKFKQTETAYIGRNGHGRQTGLGVHLINNIVRLEPINSKDMIANCLISIPSEDIPQLIEALQEITKQK